MEPASARAITEAIGELYEELKNSVTKTEFNELKEIVRELAEAQKRTEIKVEELAEAQKRTEAELRVLVGDHRDTRKMLGGVSDAVGYGLENMAILNLPPYLRENYNITVSGELDRRFVEYPDGRHDELNIIGEGVRNGETITICGEAKTRLSKKHVTDFLKITERVSSRGIMAGRPFLFMVTHSAVPDVVRFAEAHGLAVIPSHKVWRGGGQF